MIKRNEASFDASEFKVSSILAHDFCTDKDFEQGFYVDEFGRRHALLRAVPSYLTYTHKRTSTPDEIKKTFKKDSLDFYVNSINLFKTNKKLLHRMYVMGIVKCKILNDNNLILYNTPNVRGGLNVSSGALENSNSEKARFASKNRAIEKALANTDVWKYFVTFTLNKRKQDRFDFEKTYIHVAHFLQRRGIKYFLVAERHKKGGWHFHGLVSAELEPFLEEFDPSGCLPKYILARLAKGEILYNFADYERSFGYNVVEPCRNKDACVFYMTKYILKTFDEEYERATRRRYFCSKGLKTPTIVNPVTVDLTEFEPVRFSSLMNKVTLKRYDSQRALDFQAEMSEKVEPFFPLKEKDTESG